MPKRRATRSGWRPSGRRAETHPSAGAAWTALAGCRPLRVPFLTDVSARLETLLALPLGSLRVRFLARGRAVPRGLLEALEADTRSGARALADAIRDRRATNRAEGQRLRHLLRFETELWAAGHLHVAGVDEAGMAPLAGPVVAAAVVLPQAYKLKGLDDSKKVLDPDKRALLAEAVKRDAVAWGVGRAEVEEVDQLNIYHAGLLAMVPDFVLVDARRIPQCPAPQRGIIHGDALSASIAAASMIAKTTRDALMIVYDAQYPGYGFAVHKGYPTPQHEATLRILGACPLHRRSFAPVRQALGLEPEQGLLFETSPARTG
jgi:ribonuclease HII